MENRGKLLFEDDSSPKWYLSLEDRWLGPLKASDVYEKILSHEVSWAHYLWKPGQADWKRACDLKVFQAVLPQTPSKEVQTKVKGLVAPSSTQKREVLPPTPLKRERSTQKVWYVHDQNSQFGPFSLEEVQRLIQIGKIKSQAFAWRDGMENWEKLLKIREFQEVSGKIQVPRGALSREKSSDQRGAPRRPLVARIFLTHQDSVIVAVCRDISVGGMQVLTDRIPGNPGTHLKMNVSPAGDSKGNRIQPFIAEGEIVRVLEDHCGFSFRFEKLPDRAKRAIQNYIDSA